MKSEIRYAFQLKFIEYLKSIIFALPVIYAILYFLLYTLGLINIFAVLLPVIMKNEYSQITLIDTYISIDNTCG